MALSINQAPEAIVLSGEPAIFVVSSTTQASTNHKIHLRVLRDNNGSFEVIGQEVLPAINNSATFDVSDYLKRNIKLGLNIFNLFNQSVNSIDLGTTFQFEIFETYNNDDTERNLISWGDLISYQGGFSTIFGNNYRSALKNFYDNIVLGDQKFLTWSPDKKLAWNQHDLLFFLAPASGSNVDIFPRFVINFSDGTQQTIERTATPIVYGSLHYVSTSYLIQGFAGLETETRRIESYTVQIITDTLFPVTEEKTYYLDRNIYNQSRQFIFKNSLSGYDIIFLPGISKNTNEFERTVGFFREQDDISHSEFKEAYQVASGFLANSYKSVAEAQRYITELFNSQEIYEIIGREFIPVVPKDKKIKIKKDDEFLYAFDFKYEYAYSDRHFAPFDMEQYFNPILSYNNVSISNAVQGQTATINFDAMINADVGVTFEIDWGADIGISVITTTMQDGVWQTLQSSIEIPVNANLNQNLVITDSIGNTYSLSYTILEAMVFTINPWLVASTNFQLPLPNTPGYNIKVYWGDGTNSHITSYAQAETLHNYPNSNERTISIAGYCPGFTFNNSGDKLKIISVDKWANLGFTNMTGAFYGCSNMILFNGGDADFSKIGTFVNFFQDCTSLETVISTNWNTSGISTFYRFMYNCHALKTIDVSNWNVSSCSNFDQSFRSCRELTELNLSNWNVANSLSFNFFAQDCRKLKNLNIENWNVSKSLSFSNFASQCYALKSIDISNWNAAKATTFGGFVSDCTTLQSINASGLLAPLSTNFSSFAKNCYALTDFNVTNMDVSAATTMQSFIENCNSLTTIDVSNWNTSNLGNLFYFAYNCTSLVTCDTANWDTSNIGNCSWAWRNCSSLTSSFINTKWWDRSPAIGSYTVCFQNSTNIPEYDSIPTPWK